MSEHIRTPHEVDAGAPDDPRVWIGALAAYNAGYLHGSWVGMNRELPDIENDRDHVLATSPEPAEEEWFIADSDNYGELRVGEYESLERLQIVAEAIAEHGEAVTAWLEHVGWDDTDAEALRYRISQFEDAYLGEYDDARDYVAHYLDESGLQDEIDRLREQLPEGLQGYLTFDEAGYARDLTVELYIADATNGRVWVFDTRL